jgi:hypothetical protein
MITAMARSITLPRRMNVLKSFSIGRLLVGGGLAL